MTTMVLSSPQYCATAAPAWAPRTDVVETEAGFQLQLDLPGVKREDLDIQLENGSMLIKGERKLAADPDAYHRVERPFGAFQRSFLLPDQVNQAAIEAKLENGVLNLFLPRREESKPKQIQVQVQ